MNRRGAFNFIVYLVMIFFVIAFIALFFGGFINTNAQAAIASTGMTGIEAFLYSNIVTIMLLAIALGVVSYIYFGGQ